MNDTGKVMFEADISATSALARIEADINIDDDCLLQIMTHMPTIDLRSMLCTCKRVGIIWEASKNVLQWRADADMSEECWLTTERYLYGNIKLSQVQVRTISYLWRTQYDMKDLILPIGDYVQLPMSAGKTIIQLVYCIERARVRGGTSIAVFTDKMVETAISEISNILGHSSGVMEVSGVEIYPVTTRSDAANASTRSGPLVVITSRQFFYGCMSDNCHTVTLDEVQVGHQTVSNIVTSCSSFDDVHLSCFTAASAKRSDNVVILKNATREMNGMNESIILSYYGSSDITDMNLPVAIYKLMSTDRSDGYFYTSPDPSIVLRIGSIVDDFYYSTSCKKKDIARWEEDHTIRERCINNMSLLCDAVRDMGDNRVFVIVGTEDYCGVSQHLFAHKMLLEYNTRVWFAKSLKNIDPTDRVVIGTAISFSEGINLPMFSHVVLLNPSRDAETVRQCVGRFQRLTNKSKEIKISIITDSCNVALCSMVPRSITESYMNVRKTLGLNCNTTINPMVTPDITLGEITALCYKTNSTAVTREWLSKNGMFNFNPDMKRITGQQWYNRQCSTIASAHVFMVDPSNATSFTIPLFYRQQTHIVSQPQIVAPTVNVCINIDEVKSKLSYTIYNPNKRSGTYTIDQLKALCDTFGVAKNGSKTIIANNLLSRINNSHQQYIY